MEKRSKGLIIAVDGPAGSGKSTISKIIAKKLGLLYVDTGAMYRALTLKAMRKGLELKDESALINLTKSTKIDLEEKTVLCVYLDGEDVTIAIREPEVTASVKYVARVPAVRHEMVALQRSIGSKKGAVLEGRDIGTVVFPEADYKFYLDATPEERANRRRKDLFELGRSVDVEEVKKELVARDESDINRNVGALKKAEDAITIDTTDRSIEEVVDRILTYIS